MAGTTTQVDLALLLVVVGLTALVALAMHLSVLAARAVVPPRPRLPAEDCAPSGLGRLVPVGSQVDREYRTGVQALEDWLAALRRP